MYVKDLVADARKSADRIVAEAREFAEQTIDDARAEAESSRSAAQHQLEDLTRQHDSINSYLDELRGMLGTPTEAAPAKPALPAKPKGLSGATPAQQARFAVVGDGTEAEPEVAESTDTGSMPASIPPSNPTPVPVGTATVVIPSVKGTKASTKAGQNTDSAAENEDAEESVTEKAGASRYPPPR
jgi:hypothetical protein